MEVRGEPQLFFNYRSEMNIVWDDIRLFQSGRDNNYDPVIFFDGQLEFCRSTAIELARIRKNPRDQCDDCREPIESIGQNFAG